MFNPPPVLSPAGEHRRELIAARAIEEAARLRHRRARGRLAGASALIAVGIGLGVWQWSSRPLRMPVVIHHGIPDHLVPLEQPHGPAIAQLVTERGLSERLTMPAPTAGWTRIDDAQLIQELDGVRRPAGLAYVDGQPRLLFQGTSDAAQIKNGT